MDFLVIDNDKCGVFQNLLFMSKFIGYMEARYQRKYFKGDTKLLLCNLSIFT